MAKKDELSIALNVFKLLNGLTAGQINSVRIIVDRLVSENAVLKLTGEEMKALAEKELSVKSVKHSLYVH
jgi:hypothetical protein